MNTLKTKEMTKAEERFVKEVQLMLRMTLTELLNIENTRTPVRI